MNWILTKVDEKVGAVTYTIEEPITVEFEIDVLPRCSRCDREWCEALDGTFQKDGDNLCQYCVKR